MIDEDNAVQLLRRFVDEQLQEAFAELVRQKIGLVYSIALRQVAGDGHLAQDVAQRAHCYSRTFGRARKIQTRMR